MNRRGFFGAVAAIMVAPKAVKLLPPRVTTIMTPWIKLPAPHLKIVGISGWLPTGVERPYNLDRTFRPPTVMGRAEQLAEYLENGWISPQDYARLSLADAMRSVSVAHEADLYDDPR